jgi:hypothetical protein
MSEEPITRSAEEIHNDLLSEAEQQLKEVERELSELEDGFREVKMVEFAARGQPDDILLSNEKRLLKEFFESREDAKRKKQFWQARLMALQEYDIQSFERSYKYDTR